MSSPSVIRSKDHPLVQHLCQLQRSATYRKEQGHFLLYAQRIIEERCQDLPIKLLILPEGTPEPRGLTAEKIRWFAPQLIGKITNLSPACDWLAELQLPEEQEVTSAMRHLILDQVSDPGNAGSLLRTALALGWDGVTFIKGGVDPFNDKLLRASRGALLALPYSVKSAEELAQELQGELLYVADPRGQPLQQIPPPTGRFSLVVGHETRGSQSFAHSQTLPIAIPMAGPMESLNVAVAGGILIYALPSCPYTKQ